MMFQDELLSYGLTLIIGALSGFAGSYYTKMKKLIKLLSEIIEDDKITPAEINKILKILQ